jgi:hypothetical protein
MKYIMNTSKTDGRYHEVHHDDCSYKPDTYNQAVIGIYFSDRDAMNAAKILYSDADGCYYCMPSEHHG